MKKFLGSCFFFFFPELNTGCIFSGIQSKVTVLFQCSYVQYHKQKWVQCPWALLHYFTHFNVVVGTDLYSWKTSFKKFFYDGLSIDGSFQHRRLCVILVHFNSMAWGFKKKKIEQQKADMNCSGFYWRAHPHYADAHLWPLRGGGCVFRRALTC